VSCLFTEEDSRYWRERNNPETAAALAGLDDTSVEIRLRKLKSVSSEALARELSHRGFRVTLEA
jgi:hypothetical protein